MSVFEFDLYLSIITSGNITANGLLPTIGRAAKTAWPKPSGADWRTEITVTSFGTIERTSSSRLRFTRASSVASSSKLVSKWFSIEFFEACVTSTISLMPAATASLTTY